MNFRSLIDWIAGRTAPAASDHVSSGSERRRFSRLSLSDGEARIAGLPAMPIVNLSFGGLRLKLPEGTPPEDWPLGKTTPASLVLGSIQFETDLRVCNTWGREIGCSFVGASAGLTRLLSEFLKPRLLGASLREIKSAQPRSIGPDLQLRWFQGDDGTEVYLWEKLDGGLVKEELFFLDYCVSWEKEGDGLRTAKVAEGTGRQGYGRMDQNSLVFFRIPSHRALKMGQVIMLASTIPSEARDRFLARMALEERRLYSRYVLGTSDHPIILHLKALSASPLEIVNLSLHGLAFLRPEGFSPESTPPAGQWEGTLHLPDQIISIRFRLVYTHENVAGGALEVAEASAGEALAAFLAPRLLGQSLEEHPATLDELPPRPRNSQTSLFIGVHNTHLLSVLTAEGDLHLGRLAFMDRVMVFERKTLKLFSCSRGIIFPREWDLPSGQTEPIAQISDEFLEVCRHMLASSRLSASLIKAWETVLDKTST